MALGFEQAGFDVLAAVDLDPLHLAAHERNFPLCEPVCGDVGETTAEELIEAARRGWKRRDPGAPMPEPIDCVFGGPSCQGFSVIGPRDADDPRNALVSEFARAVLELRPRWFVMENVPGLVSPRYRPTLEAFYETLQTAGYEVDDPWSLNASHHSVPQDRKRVFVVGAQVGETLPSPPDPTKEAPTVRDAIGDLARLGRFRSLRNRDAIELRDDQLAALDRRQSAYVRRLNGVEADSDDLSDPRAWNRRLLTSVGLASHSDDVAARFKRLQPGERDKIGRLPKLDPTRQSPTLRAGTGRDHGSFTAARPVHHASPRVIAVREAARLHGFPDWFSFHATKWHGFRQVGNAVPPPLARAVAKVVVEAGNAAPMRRGEPLQLGSEALLEMTLDEAGARYALDPLKLPRNVRAIAGVGEREAA